MRILPSEIPSSETFLFWILQGVKELSQISTVNLPGINPGAFSTPSRVPLIVCSGISPGISARIDSKVLSGIKPGIASGIPLTNLPRFFQKILQDSFRNSIQDYYKNYLWDSSQKSFRNFSKKSWEIFLQTSSKIPPGTSSENPPGPPFGIAPGFLEEFLQHIPMIPSSSFIQELHLFFYPIITFRIRFYRNSKK